MRGCLAVFCLVAAVIVFLFSFGFSWFVSLLLLVLAVLLLAPTLSRRDVEEAVQAALAAERAAQARGAEAVPTAPPDELPMWLEPPSAPNPVPGDLWTDFKALVRATGRGIRRLFTQP